MSDFFSQPDDLGAPLMSEEHSSLGARLGAQALDAIDPKNSLSGMYLLRRAREGIAGGFAPHDFDELPGMPGLQAQDIVAQARAAIPDVSIDDAKARVRQEGLDGHLHLPASATIKAPVLDLMIGEAHERRDREVAISQGPQGFIPGALGFVTSLGAGMVDPVNMAAFSIPVLGEARWGRLMASAGDSIMARGGVRALQGGAQGAAGTAILQPADWWLHTSDGEDYTFGTALQSVLMGAGMGAAFHSAIGAVGDIRARRNGAPLPGSPADLVLRGQMAGRHIPGEALADEGISAEDLAFHLLGESPVPPIHPASVLADLPPPAREDVARVAIADMAADRPVRGDQVLQIAADHDPRIAESFDAWHGSPHDFDRFDASKLGTGEGAQAYGHGLYFAENEKVARGYQRATSDKAFVNKVAELYDEGHSPDEAWAEIKDNWKDFSPAEQRLMAALEKDDWLGFDYPHQAVSAALRDIKAFDVSPETAAAAKAVGNIYRVKINANHDHFLDWDKPIEEQSEHVRKALLEHPDSMIAGTFAKHGHSPSQAYTRIAVHLGNRAGQTFEGAMRGEGYGERQAMASKALADAGIPGIKYLDAGSRDAGDGTRNFVVFDDKHIEITHKNGEAVKLPERALPTEAAPRLPGAVKPKAARGRAAANPETWSLNEFLASKGGLKPDPELAAIFGGKNPFVPGFGPLIRKSGMALDEALSQAKQHGYMSDPHDAENGAAGAGGRTSHGLTPNDLLDHLDAENRGQKLYKAGHLEATKYDPEQEKHVIMGALEHELEAAGEDVSAIDPKLLNRTVEIVHREGVSNVLDAYERAIMEDAERYDAIAAARQDDPVLRDIPGFDDGRAAPGDGAGDRAGGGQAGRTDAAGRGADDPQSRSHGGRAAAAADDPRWRELADTRPAELDPDIVAESRAAEQLAEPDSLVPEKSLTAAEKAAAEAEAIWRDFQKDLTEDERTLVNDRLDALKADKEGRDQVIKDGVACLVGAFG